MNQLKTSYSYKAVHNKMQGEKSINIELHGKILKISYSIVRMSGIKGAIHYPIVTMFDFVVNI